jgi:hypothetical protein
MGIGDWGLGIGDWANPQSPIPNPHQIQNLTNYFFNFKILILIKLHLKFISKLN